MAIETKLRKAKYDSNIEKQIATKCEEEEAKGFFLVSTFLDPVVNGEQYVILIFQKKS
jgi:hypothetical protein